MSAAVIRSHNATVLETLEPGDAVQFKRGLYSHWALYVGGGQVIHLAGDDNDGLNAAPTSGHLFTICGRQFNKAFVRLDDFFEVAGNSRADKNNRKDSKLRQKSVDEIIETAMSMIGEIGYNLMWSNCEHFVSFCRYGVKKSDQVDSFLNIATMGALVLGGAFFIRGLLKGRTEEPESDDD